MASRRKAALATFAGSSMSTLIAAAQSILLLPLYIQAVGAPLYGVWLATGELLLWMLAFDFGLPNMLIQRAGAAHARGDIDKVGRYFATGAAILMGLAVCVGAGLVLSAPLIASAFKLSESDATHLTGAFRISALATTLAIFNYAFQGLARAVQKTSMPNLFAVAGTILGFGLTAVLLNAGFGLDGIAMGLLVRSGFALAGSLLFLASREMAQVRKSLHWCAEALRDYRSQSTAMFASGLAYALMNNSQVALAAVLLRPEIAVVFSVTRKAAEFVKAFLDMFGYASVGGFSHLVAAEDDERVKTVYGELTSVYCAGAIALMAGYIAVNQGLVAVWMGSAYFGGVPLTISIALGTIAGGWSYLGISLLRSTGELRLGSLALICECAARLVLMVGFTYVLGIVGLSLAALITATASGIWARANLAKRLSGLEFASFGAISLRAAPILLGITIALLSPPRGWLEVLFVGGVVCSVSAVLSLVSEAPLTRHRSKIQQVLTRRAA